MVVFIKSFYVYTYSLTFMINVSQCDVIVTGAYKRTYKRINVPFPRWCSNLNFTYYGTLWLPQPLILWQFCFFQRPPRLMRGIPLLDSGILSIAAVLSMATGAEFLNEVPRKGMIIRSP